ncbi:AAA family ATPase [Anaeromicropila populeti]|uniref:AAA family ATPase n=1 Tax=Anaeromicropila populeti TaxID=37658 RepID=UPI0038B76BCA
MQYEDKINRITGLVEQAIIGKRSIIEKVMMAILAKGHILVEDIPGVGKTTLAVAFSKAMNLKQVRMQFTPDVLPSDVIGFNVLDSHNNMEFKEGAVFCNLFLADEINRTSPKTQSALLEVMEEGKITVDGQTRLVPNPFVVIATQNPVGSIGTQMLPESQLDRFMVRLTIGYPDIQSEINILKSKQKENPLHKAQNVINEDELLEMQERVDTIYIHDKVYDYVGKLVYETRNHSMIELGVSPRGTIALMSMAKGRAFVKGREYVNPDDLKSVFKDVVCHRILLNAQAKYKQISVDAVADDILNKVPAPRVV